jgi:hypothetical protein
MSLLAKAACLRKWPLGFPGKWKSNSETIIIDEVHRLAVQTGVPLFRYKTNQIKFEALVCTRWKNNCTSYHPLLVIVKTIAMTAYIKKIEYPVSGFPI